jgi:hypothetical protein
VNMVQKCVYMHVHAKIISFETIPGMGRGDKGE